MATSVNPYQYATTCTDRWTSPEMVINNCHIPLTTCTSCASELGVNYNGTNYYAQKNYAYLWFYKAGYCDVYQNSGISVQGIHNHFDHLKGRTYCCEWEDEGTCTADFKLGCVLGLSGVQQGDTLWSVECMQYVGPANGVCFLFQPTQGHGACRSLVANYSAYCLCRMQVKICKYDYDDQDWYVACCPWVNIHWLSGFNIQNTWRANASPVWIHCCDNSIYEKQQQTFRVPSVFDNPTGPYTLAFNLDCYYYGIIDVFDKCWRECNLFHDCLDRGCEVYATWQQLTGRYSCVVPIGDLPEEACTFDTRDLCYDTYSLTPTCNFLSHTGNSPAINIIAYNGTSLAIPSSEVNYQDNCAKILWANGDGNNTNWGFNPVHYGSNANGCEWCIDPATGCRYGYGYGFYCGNYFGYPMFQTSASYFRLGCCCYDNSIGRWVACGLCCGGSTGWMHDLDREHDEHYYYIDRTNANSEDRELPFINERYCKSR